MNENNTKSRAIFNLIFALLWISCAALNAMSAAVAEKNKANMMLGAVIMGVIDMMLARADFTIFYGIMHKKKANLKVTDESLNTQSIVAAIGVALCMNLTANEAFENGVTAWYVICSIVELFLMIASFTLSVEARKDDNANDRNGD